MTKCHDHWRVGFEVVRWVEEKGVRAAMTAMIEGGNLDVASHTSRTLPNKHRRYYQSHAATARDPWSLVLRPGRPPVVTQEGPGPRPPTTSQRIQQRFRDLEGNNLR